MSRQTQAISRDVRRLAEDARALVSATADDAREKVAEARRHLTQTLESRSDLCGRARDRAVEKAMAADSAVHHHPYPAILIAFGVGALVGELLARRFYRNGG